MAALCPPLEQLRASAHRALAGPGGRLWQITLGNLPVFGRVRSDLAGLA